MANPTSSAFRSILRARLNLWPKRSASRAARGAALLRDGCAAYGCYASMTGRGLTLRQNLAESGHNWPLELPTGIPLSGRALRCIS